MTDIAPTSPSTLVRTSQPKEIAAEPRAHGFFWTVLAAAAVVSITGNATQALLHSTTLPAVAAAVAIIPPLALLAAVHGATVLARAHATARTTQLIATGMTILIATGAFWLSFTALRSLAITAGIPRAEAWLWPVIIEGSMAQATVALLALAHSTHRPSPQHGDDTVTSDVVDDHRPPIPLSATAHRAHTSDFAPGDVREIEHVAAHLCARDPARRRDPELVAKALAHHYHDGWNPTRIARELGKSRSTISRILSDADRISLDT